MTRRFGNKVLELRESLDLSQIELARRINVHRGHLCKLEAGKANPSPELIDRLASVLSADAIELYAMAEVTPKGKSYAELSRWSRLIGKYKNDRRFGVELVKE